MEWMPVSSVEQFSKLVDEAEREKRKVRTNYISQEGRTLFNTSTPLFSKEGNNLYIIARRDNINKLYYWCIEVPHGRFDYDGEVVCDILERKGRERHQDFVSYLKKNGFAEYAKYYEWKRADEKYEELWKNPLEYSEVPDLNAAFRIYEIFDTNSDALPEKDIFPEYYKGLESVFLKDQGKCAAFLLYKKKMCSVREEWLWVDKEYRRSGYAVWMLKKMINNCLGKDGGNIRHFTWINENNEESVLLHRKLGMEKTLRYKTTLIFR